MTALKDVGMRFNGMSPDNDNGLGKIDGYQARDHRVSFMSVFPVSLACLESPSLCRWVAFHSNVRLDLWVHYRNNVTRDIYNHQTLFATAVTDSGNRKGPRHSDVVGKMLGQTRLVVGYHSSPSTSASFLDACTVGHLNFSYTDSFKIDRTNFAYMLTSESPVQEGLALWLEHGSSLHLSHCLGDARFFKPPRCTWA